MKRLERSYTVIKFRNETTAKKLCKALKVKFDYTIGFDVMPYFVDYHWEYSVKTNLYPIPDSIYRFADDWLNDHPKCKELW